MPALTGLLCSPHESVQLPALQCLATFVYNSEPVAKLIQEQDLNSTPPPPSASSPQSSSSSSSPSSPSAIRQIVRLMERDRKVDTQLAAARCMTYLYRCRVMEEEDQRITFKALPCVVRRRNLTIIVNHPHRLRYYAYGYELRR